MSLPDAAVTVPVSSGEAARGARRRSHLRFRTGTLGAAILAAAAVVATGAPYLAPTSPLAQNLLLRLRPPGTHGPAAAFWLGTDGLGRDVLSRLLFGARVSLVVAGLAIVFSGAVGTALGMLAGYYRGRIGAVLMRFVDMVLSIPFLLLAIAVVAVLGPSLLNTVLVLGLTRWPRYARVAFAQTLAARRREFVEAARALGSADGRLMVRHVLPEVLPSAVVVATLEVGLMIVFEAALSFLGLGVQPPTPSWGSMLADGRDYLATAWWLATFPGLAIMLTVLGANLLGDEIRDRLDPRVR